TVIVYVLTMTALVAALRRKREESQAIVREEASSRVTRVVNAAVGLTVLILFGLLVSSVSTGHSMSLMDNEPALFIKVTASQWWWKFEYQDPVPSLQVTTANEIHIPVGRP